MNIIIVVLMVLGLLMLDIIGDSVLRIEKLLKEKKKSE